MGLLPVVRTRPFFSCLMFCFEFLILPHSNMQKEFIMNMNEMIRSKLDGLIPNDLLQTIENTVRKYEQLASAEGSGKKVWMLLATAEVITWIAASDRDELLDIVQGIRVNPNSVEWCVEDCEGLKLHIASTGDEEGDDQIVDLSLHTGTRADLVRR